MNARQLRERMRAILAGDKCVTPAAIFDPVSARVAQLLGFEAAIMPGSAAALAVLGAPDLTLITLSELAEQSRRICRAAAMPLLVDADHGYGNALNVMRTVAELENAGVAALTIEDTLLPAPFNGGNAAALIPADEAVGKLRAALQARSDQALVIAGRTSAAVAGSLDELLVRVKRYEATGVDAIFLSGMKERHQLEAVAAHVRIPVILGLAPEALADRQYLGALGVRMNHRGHPAVKAWVNAIHDALSSTRMNTSADPKEDRPTAEELLGKIVRQSEYEDWMQAYLMPTDKQI